MSKPKFMKGFRKDEMSRLNKRGGAPAQDNVWPRKPLPMSGMRVRGKDTDALELMAESMRLQERGRNLQMEVYTMAAMEMLAKETIVAMARSISGLLVISFEDMSKGIDPDEEFITFDKARERASTGRAKGFSFEQMHVLMFGYPASDCVWCRGRARHVDEDRLIENNTVTLTTDEYMEIENHARQEAPAATAAARSDGGDPESPAPGAAAGRGEDGGG